MNPRQVAVTCALSLLAAACATVPREPAAVADAAALAAPFEIEGRMSARRGSDGGAAHFTWRHDGTSDEVDLATPLGQTLARLSGNGGGVRAQWPDGRVVEARDWDELTERAIGVPIPVQGLAAWLRGYGRAGSPGAVERDPRGRPSILRQDGWEIAYAYPDDAATRAGRVTLRYAQGEPTEVRLVIDRWQ